MSPPDAASWRPHPAGSLAVLYGLTYVFFALTTRVFQIPSDLPTLIPSFALGLIPALTVALYLISKRRPTATRNLSRYRHPLFIVSGVATATIALSTVLALASKSATILFVLVLMRGGVLVLSPAIDFVAGRTIHRNSLIALTLSIAAVGVALAGRFTDPLDIRLFIVLGFYLSAYAVRLFIMNRSAKAFRKGLRADFFTGESISHILLLSITSVVLLFFNASSSVDQTVILSASGVLVGFAYGAVLVFGSMIYLDPRELSFAVPLNRGASLCAGLATSLLLALFTEQTWPSFSQWAAGMLVIAALAILLRQAPSAALAIKPVAAFKVSTAPKA